MCSGYILGSGKKDITEGGHLKGEEIVRSELQKGKRAGAKSLRQNQQSL